MSEQETKDEVLSDEQHYIETGHFPACEVYEGTQRGQCSCSMLAIRDIPGVRIGYLEEALRHIHVIAEANGDRDVQRLAMRALQSGDPITCPEAR